MTKASSGGAWKGAATDAPTPVRRVSTVPSLDSCLGVESGRLASSVLSMSPTGNGPTNQPAFCRICLESKALPMDPPETPFPQLPFPLSMLYWRGKGGAEEADRLISPCACTGTQAYVHYTCLRAWQKSVVSSARYAEDGNCQAASMCSVCLHRFTVQPPAVALHVRVQRLAEMHMRELIWFFLLLCIFYLLLANNVNAGNIIASIFAALRAAAGLDPGLAALDPSSIGPGTVLVASPTKMTSSSIFYRSVVVVYENEANSGGAIAGVIINKRIKHGVNKQLRSSREATRFLNQQGKGVPRLLGWGGPLARSAMTVMDMCPCCLHESRKGAVNSCCGCACRASKDMEQSGPGHWARYIFPGLFLGTDTQSLQILEATAMINSGCSEDTAVPRVLREGVPREGGNSSRVVLMGHTLWQPGQLEAEIRAGWWLVLSDLKNQDSTSAPLQLLWKSLVASQVRV